MYTFVIFIKPQFYRYLLGEQHVIPSYLKNLIGKLSNALSCPQEFALLLYHYTVRCSELYAICVLSITTVIVVPSWVWCPDN